ncbi:MAG: metallopeptidase family protein [Alphaproteobacteria bacterium]
MPASQQDPIIAPSLDHIERLAAAAFDSIPPALAQHVREVVIQVTDFPDAETTAQLDLESPFALLGLYSGVNLPDKSAAPLAEDIDMIFLYRRPLLDHWCETGEDLAHLVRHVLIHEIGHHFGFSDDDMAAIEMAAIEPTPPAT